MVFRTERTKLTLALSDRQYGIINQPVAFHGMVFIRVIPNTETHRCEKCGVLQLAVIISKRSKLEHE